MSNPALTCSSGKIESGFEPLTLLDLLRSRAALQANKRAYLFLPDGAEKEAAISYGELDRRARAIAAYLQSAIATGDRVLLLYPPGLEYISAFFGCLYAGAVAVPVYPPRRNRSFDRFHSIINDARPAIALATASVISHMEPVFSDTALFNGLMCKETDTIDDALANEWQEPLVESRDVAFLQYTSGSTAAPKGVMVSHENLLSNERMIQQAFQQTEESVIVGWLPLFHDMGLIGNALQPLYVGAECILMSPLTFLQRPFKWLEAISRYRGTTSGGPNFAYDLCVRKIPVEDRERLDLSSWTVAFSGSEPVRKETLDRFAAAFEPSGFNPKAFYPCYGLAEATLFVSGGRKMQGPRFKPVSRAALEQNQTAPASIEHDDNINLVSCGKAWFQQRIVIADAELGASCATGRVGEIWISGPSVAQGYWNRPEESQKTFQAYLADTGEGPFLRTGDLGFIEDGELYVTGRLKDIIIIRGRNHYPQDIEHTVSNSYTGLRSGCAAAFSVEVDGEERLVVVQEIDRLHKSADLQETLGVIRQTVFEAHELEVYAAVLIKTGSLPKTSSGKIERHTCRQAFLSGKLPSVASSILNAAADEPDWPVSNITRTDILALDSKSERQSMIERYLQEQIARALGLSPSRVPLLVAPARLGLDSLKATEIQNRVESGLNLFLPMAEFLQGANISQLASRLADELSDSTRDYSPALASARENLSNHPVSYGQQGIWFVDQLEPGNDAYNISAVFRISGRLNWAALEQSISEIVSRHEALRTSFGSAKGEPFQIINPAFRFSLPLVDLRSLSMVEPQSSALKFAATESARPFDLSQSPLFRVTLLSLAGEQHVLLLTFHHVISDGWSLGIFLREMTCLYEAYFHGYVSPLTQLPIQYVDFARWQREWLQSDLSQTQLSYWKGKFAVPPTRLDLPADHARSAETTNLGACHSLLIPGDCAEALKALSRDQDSTLFMTLLAAFKALLYCHTGQSDIVVGSPIAGRNRAEFEKPIGLFLNTLALRTDLSANPTFRQLLGRVREVALQAYKHQDLPFERIVQELSPDRSAGHAPLYQVWFVLQMASIPDFTLCGMTISNVEMELQATKFDLAFNLAESPAGIGGSIEYRPDLFEKDTIARLAEDFKTVLDNAVADPDVRLDALKESLLEKNRQKRVRKMEAYREGVYQKLKKMRRTSL